MDLLKSFTWSTPMFKIPFGSSMLLLKSIAASQTPISERRLRRARTFAAEHQFSRAIALLERIQPGASVYLEAQQHLLKYREASHLQSQQRFERAVTQVSRNNFSEAVRLLRLIPQEAHVYVQAKAKLEECQRTIEQLYLRGGSSGIR
jgi:hypothetical protein